MSNFNTKQCRMPYITNDASEDWEPVPHLLLFHSSVAFNCLLSLQSCVRAVVAPGSITECITNWYIICVCDTVGKHRFFQNVFVCVLKKTSEITWNQFLKIQNKV